MSINSDIGVSGPDTSALAALVLGIGAGLRAGELAAATGDDVVVSPSGVAVRVGTGPGRVVPVGGAYARALAALAKDAGTGYLFCPSGADGAYKNFVNNVRYTLEADPAAPRLSSGRARSSFICGHLATGTPLLRELLYISGISGVESLLHYARHHGAFYRSELTFLAKRIDDHLVRWAMQKFKRLRGRPQMAWAWLRDVRKPEPTLFAHWDVDPRMIRRVIAK